MDIHKQLAAVLSIIVLAVGAHAAKPSAMVVKACLHGKAQGHASWTAIATNRVGSDDDFQGGYKATIFTVNGQTGLSTILVCELQL